MSEERRRLLVEKLTQSADPVTGSDLAELFGVSRQVIVQDIAIIRAKGVPVLATSNGYLIQNKNAQDKLIKTFVSKHNGFERMEEEL
jgi:hypothetical protein